MQARARSSGCCGALVGLAALGALTIFAGTAATAAGPHAGGSPGQRINRLSFDGRGTMDFVIHRHGEIALAFGLAAVAAWLLARRRGAPPQVRRPLTVLCWLLALQGAVGLDQYKTHLPRGPRVGARRPGVPVVARDAVGGLRRRGGPPPALWAARAPSAAEAPVRRRGAAGVPRKLGAFRGCEAPCFRGCRPYAAVSLRAAKTLEKGVA